MFKNYFEYLSPSNIYKNLNETIDTEQNQVRVNMIKNNLASFIEKIKRSPSSDAKRIKNRNNKVEIVEHILYLFI